MPARKFKAVREFLEKRFPESRRKAYYLLAIHDHLIRISKRQRQLREMGWTKTRELVKVARREGTEFVVHLGAQRQGASEGKV